MPYNGDVFQHQHHDHPGFPADARFVGGCAARHYRPRASREGAEAEQMTPEGRWSAYQEQVEKLERRLRDFDIRQDDPLEEAAQGVRNAMGAFREIREKEEDISSVLLQLEEQYATMDAVIRSAESTLHEAVRERENPWNLTEHDPATEQKEFYRAVYTFDVPAGTPVGFQYAALTTQWRSAGGGGRRGLFGARRAPARCVPVDVRVASPRISFRGDATETAEKLRLSNVAVVARRREGANDRYTVGMRPFRGTLRISGAAVPYELASDGNPSFRPKEQDRPLELLTPIDWESVKEFFRSEVEKTGRELLEG